MVIYCHFCRDQQGSWSTYSPSSAGIPALEDAPRPVRWYQRSALCVAMYYNYCFIFILKRRWIIQTSTSERKAPFLPVPELKAEKQFKRKSHRFRRVRQPRPFPSRNASVFFFQEAAETVAEPILWVAASPFWLIPLINRFTEIQSHSSTRLRPELIVGVKEPVSKFWCQPLKNLEMLPSERLNNI